MSAAPVVCTAATPAVKHRPPARDFCYAGPAPAVYAAPACRAVHLLNTGFELCCFSSIGVYAAHAPDVEYVSFSTTVCAEAPPPVAATSLQRQGSMKL